jgi:TonB-dependent receptor
VSNIRRRHLGGRPFAQALLAGCGLTAMITGSAAAQTPVAISAAPTGAPGSVSGAVTQANGEYLDGASVAIPALDRATVADRSGRFAFSDLPAGTHDVVVRYVGFPDQRRTITVAGEPLTLDVRLDAAGADTGSNAPEGGDVVVTGSRPIAESEAAALQIQRTSPSLVSVVASDSVGRLPDQNIAQAVSRLPGVAVQRDQGQARYINLRGAPINWTTLSIDGINVVSPEGRDARFDSIPSAIASQIIVRKAVTPDMTGETIAGNVDIITRSAFDYPGFKMQAKAGVGHVELGGKTEHEGSLVISDRIDTGIGEFGIVSSGSLYRRGMVTDNFETDFEAVAEDRRPGFENRIFGRETENKLYRLTRKNYSLSTRLDWRPNDGNSKLFFETIYSAFQDDEQRSNYIFDLDDQQSRTPTGTGACTINAAPAPNTTGYADVCTGNTPLAGTVYGIDLNSNFLVRAYKQSVFTNTIGGDHALGDWKVAWRGNYTKSIDDRSAPAQLNYDSPGFGTNGATAANRLTVGYDFTDPQLAKVALYRTLRAANGTLSRGDRVTAIGDFAAPLARLRVLDAKDVTEAYTAKLDISRETNFGNMPVTLAAGLRYDDRNKTANEYLLDINGTNAAGAALFARAGIPTDFGAIAIPGGFQGEIPLGYTFQYFGRDKVLDLAERAKTVASQDFVPANFYDVTEKVYSGYAMATATMNWGSIIGGARVEHIRNDSRAFVTNAAGAATSTIRRSGEQTLVYPSLHLNWDVNDAMKARLSFNTGAARPDYDQLRPNRSFNDGNLTISGGNPDATPEKARGVDLYVEYYTMPRGFLSIGVFYKDVKDVLFNVSNTFGSDALNSGGIDRSQYVFSSIANGGDGYLIGLEAAIQQQLEPFVADLGLPDWMGGFGVQLNTTLNKSRSETPDGRKIRLPGTSDAVYNLIGYYEKYGFSARVSYQNRSPWIDSIGSFGTVNGIVRGIDGGDAYWARDDELDASVRYAITPNVEIYGDFANLLNGPGRRFVGSSRYTIEHETFGRRYTGGVRVSF